MKEAALFARDELRFDHIVAVSGTDYMAKSEIEVIYFVGSSRPDQEDLVIALAERIKQRRPRRPLARRGLAGRRVPREGDLRDARREVRGAPRPEEAYCSPRTGTTSRR